MSLIPSQEHELLTQLDDRNDAMVKETRRLAEINSGSTHHAGVIHVNRELKDLFAPICETQEEVALENIPQVEDDGHIASMPCAKMQLFSARPNAPVQLLCTGHSDTVFPQDSAFQSTWIEDNHLRGPGVADMKGGLIVLLEALRAIHHSPFREAIGFTVAISPDEEIGSPSSAPVLTQLAQKAHFGLTYEPALADGTLAGARKGSGNFHVVITGKSAHAGREFFQGRNAVTAASHLAIALEALSDQNQGITVNVGKISGGGPVNVVPDNAVCRFNVRIEQPSQQGKLLDNIHTILQATQQLTGCEMILHGGFNRPPKPVGKKQQAMFDLLKECGQQLDIPIAFKATGGCCEGNNLAAAGLVNIDTLGVRGGHIHSDQEFACIDSFVERAKLSALLIAKLSQHSPA